MIRTTILVSIAAAIIAYCNNSGNKTMSFHSTTDQETKPDSTIGYASVNGLKMYYEIHGTGYPLVLIHGGGSTLQTTFGRVLHNLAKTHKVIAVEMQAHGHLQTLRGL